MAVKWNGKEYGTGNEKVFATSPCIDDLLKIIDGNSLRSFIENKVFRELKQSYLSKEKRGEIFQEVFSLNR